MLFCSTVFMYLSAGQCVSHSLQQRFDLRAGWQLLFSPGADCNAQELLHKKWHSSKSTSLKMPVVFFFFIPTQKHQFYQKGFLLPNNNLQVKFCVIPTAFIYISRHTLISMRMSEGREALWLQCGGQDATLSLPCFLLGVVDCSWVTSSTPAKSPESGATGLPTAFITRSYLLFHSRLIRAGG